MRKKGVYIIVNPLKGTSLGFKALNASFIYHERKKRRIVWEAIKKASLPLVIGDDE